MKEKKTVLFLMNGLGAEGNKSLEVIDQETMPTFQKLMGAYPFKLLYAGGEFVGLNQNETSNFKTGYYNFSTFGHPTKKEEIIEKKIITNEFLSGEVLNHSIDYALNNGSRFHVMFELGNKVNDVKYNQFKKFLEYVTSKGIKEIYLHLVLGDSSLKGLKIGNECITDFRNRVMRYVNNIKIASICGRKYIKDGSKQEASAFYRMLVSGVGEVWVNYSETIQKRYDKGQADDTLAGFITIREPLLRENDSLFVFNYGNTMSEQLINIIQNPKKFFPTSNVPKGIIVSSLFALVGSSNVPYCFNDELPGAYFLDKIPETNKILLIANKTRIPYISKCLNGFRETFKSNLSVWPIETNVNRFDSISQYLAAYINQDAYSLIIVDCELYDPTIDERTVEQIRKNLRGIDKCINIAYNCCMEKNYRFIGTSLYGIKQTFKLTKTMELIDFSAKVPFMLIDKEIRMVDVVFKSEGTFIDVAKIIAISFGSNMPNNLMVLSSPLAKEGKNKKMNQIVIIAVVALLALFVLYYLRMSGYI